MLIRKPLLYDKKKSEFHEGYYFTLIEFLLEDDPTRAGFEEENEEIEGTPENTHAFGEEVAP